MKSVCFSVCLAFCGLSAFAQEYVEPPFTGAARVGSTWVSGVKVTANWVYGRNAEVFVSVDGDVSQVGAEILEGVQRLTGCVGQRVRKTAGGTSEFEAVVRANCRTGWHDGKARYVQIATVFTQRAADDLFIELNLAGLDSSIRRSRSNGRTHFGILTSAYSSPSEVSEVLAYVRALGYRDAFVR